MKVLEEIYTIISGDSTIDALVGDNVFPIIVPEGHSVPAVVFTVLEEVPHNTKSEHSCTDEYVVEIYSISTDVLESIQINDAVRLAMEDGETGNIAKIFYREGISHAFDFIDPEDASAIAYSFISRYKIFYNR